MPSLHLHPAVGSTLCEEHDGHKQLVPGHRPCTLRTSLPLAVQVYSNKQEGVESDTMLASSSLCQDQNCTVAARALGFHLALVTVQNHSLGTTASFVLAQPR